MVDFKTAISSVRNTIEQGSYLNAINEIIIREVDFEGEDSAIKSPFMEITVVSNVQSDPHDTNLVGYETDANGNRTGRIFSASFELDLQMDIYVAAGDAGHDATDLGTELFRALRKHDEREQSLPLPDSDGNPLDDVTHFRLGDGDRNDDLSMSPSIRRWTKEARLSFKDDVSTSEPYVKTVQVQNEATGGTTTAIELTI